MPYIRAQYEAHLRLLNDLHDTDLTDGHRNRLIARLCSEIYGVGLDRRDGRALHLCP